MPKKPWATEEQLNFLTSKLPRYHMVQLTKEYSGFWPHLYEDWFAQWPEKTELFPDKPGDKQLTADEEKSLGLALKIRREVNFLTCIRIVEMN